MRTFCRIARQSKPCACRALRLRSRCIFRFQQNPPFPLQRDQIRLFAFLRSGISKMPPPVISQSVSRQPGGRGKGACRRAANDSLFSTSRASPDTLSQTSFSGSPRAACRPPPGRTCRQSGRPASAYRLQTAAPRCRDASAGRGPFSVRRLALETRSTRRRLHSPCCPCGRETQRHSCSSTYDTDWSTCLTCSRRFAARELTCHSERPATPLAAFSPPATPPAARGHRCRRVGAGPLGWSDRQTHIY